MAKKEREMKLVKETAKHKTFADAYPGYLGYYRMYWRRGWSGRWFTPDGDTPISGDCVTKMNKSQIAELNEVIGEIADKWPSGCDYRMEMDLEEIAEPVEGVEHRYLMKAVGKSATFVVLADTTFGNGDYPIRIYVYACGEH